MTSSPLKDAVSEELLERLANGESLGSICRDEKMPAWSTVHEWMENDAKFSGRIMRAREHGYALRADRAVAEAKSAEDAAKGRLALDAERWYLGKLSNAFTDKVKHIGGDAGDAPIAVKVEEVRRVVIDPHNRDAS